jgi:hypothetical protein
MKRGVASTLALAAAWSAAISLANAQTEALPTESVTVSGQKLAPQEKLQDFIHAYATRSGVAAKMARWKAGICPIVAGLPDAHGKFITERVRQVAAQAGAPVAAAGCKPNIDIVFTLHPQVLLDGMRKKSRVLLGYHEAAEEDRLATVSHPVQAWYTTQTVDLRGSTSVDDKLRKHGGFYIDNPMGMMYPPIFIPDAPVVQVTGDHMGDGLSSELYHVVMVIDLARIEGQTLGALADYAAMLSLAQTQSFEACAPVSSITNLESPGCGNDLKADAVTANDLAYLQALYRTDPRATFAHQQSDIVTRMLKAAHAE